MAGKIKKKLKKWLLMLFIQCLPILIVVIVIAAGLTAVKKIFDTLVSWVAKIGSANISQIGDMSEEDFLAALDDRELFDEETMLEMMIDRLTLSRLMSGVRDYNNREEKRTISVEFGYSYTKIEKDANGNLVPITYTGTEFYNVSVSNNHLIEPYDLDWQTVLIFGLLRSIANYENWEEEGGIFDEYGNYIPSEQLTMTAEEVDEILETLKPSFIYTYDVVNNSKTTYTQADVASLPNMYVSWQTTDEDGTVIDFSGYVPISVLNRVDGVAFTDVYNMNGTSLVGITSYSANDRFILKGERFYPYFNLELFYELLRNLPNGEKMVEKYDYILNQTAWEGQ